MDRIDVAVRTLQPAPEVQDLTGRGGDRRTVAHLLPAQRRIGVFIHQNTLRALQHLRFQAAVRQAAAVYGAAPCSSLRFASFTPKPFAGKSKKSDAAEFFRACEEHIAASGHLFPGQAHPVTASSRRRASSSTTSSTRCSSAAALSSSIGASLPGACPIANSAFGKPACNCLPSCGLSQRPR